MEISVKIAMRLTFLRFFNDYKMFNISLDINSFHIYTKRLCILFSLNSRLGVRVMVFNGTFNNISVISWQSV